MKVLKKILESDSILSRRLQNKTTTYGFNGLDYISLCDYDKSHPINKLYPRHTAYDQHIKSSLSLMFPKDKITVIQPQLLEHIGISQEDVENMKKLGLSQDQRYSDLCDEVQVKDKVPLEVMNGITMPLYHMTKGIIMEKTAKDYVSKEIEQIKELLIKYNHEVPIYDIESFISLDDEQNTQALIKKYTKRIY